MKRNIESKLLQWFKNEQRKPLLLRGARQVGKSTVVRNFCLQNNIQLVEVNLEKAPLQSLERPGYNMQDVIDEIELATQVKLSNKKSLLFLDEIQAQPKAITALRYFKEDHPKIAVLAAGSLLEIVLSQTSISFPVGRIEIEFLGPLSFAEFVMNTKPMVYKKWIETSIAKMSAVLFDQLKESYFKFLFIGGMPEAVNSYIEKSSLLEVRKIQKTIIDTYRADFPKYAKSSELSKIDLVFDGLVHVLGEKVKYNKINPELKSKDIKRILALFEQARILIPCIHSNASSFPLSAQLDDSVKKLYFLDVGLYNALMKNNLEELYEKEQSAVKGQMAEQFVAQHLFYNENLGLNRNLFYWLKDKTTSKAEVDFLIQQRSKIIPCEVKSEKLTRLKSLLVFMQEHKSKLGVKLSLEPYQITQFKEKISDGKSAVSVSAHLMTLPIFCIDRIYTEIDFFNEARVNS